MRTRLIRWSTFAVVGILVLGCALYYAFVAFGISESRSYDRMIQSNYEINRAALLHIESFIRAKHPIDFSIAELPRISVVTYIPHETGESYFYRHDVKIDEQWLLYSLALIGWTRKDLDRLCKLLQHADCISMRYYAPRIPQAAQGIAITYRSHWMLGRTWEYIVFPESLTAAQMERSPEGYRQSVKMLDHRIGWMAAN